MAYRNFANPELSRRSLFRGGAYAAAGATLATLPFGRELLAHSVDESWPNVAALAKKYIDERKVAQMYLTFGWGQEDHAHHVGGGTLALNSDVEVDENSLYRIYSMTKPVTGMAAMILIDEGVMGLDQPIHEFLPAYKDMMVQVEYDGAITEDNLEPAKSHITVRHLLTHTAGIGYGIIQQGPIVQAYNEAGIIAGRVSRLPIPGIFQGAPVGSLEAFADGLAQFPLVLQPGTKFSYSMSLDLLGRVIEVAAGQPFDQFLKERIFDPCGMDSTYFQVPSADVGRLTDNYGILNGNAFPIDPAATSIYLDEAPFPTGGAGLVSSPKDYDRFLRMLLGYGKLGETRVMSDAAVRKGVSNLFPEGTDLAGTWMEGQGHGAGGRSVNGTFGWGGAAGTLAAVDYNLGLRACLFTQYMPTDAYPIRDEYLAALEADTAAMRAKKAA
ncbi:serine hydrolase domain-containing protein [uncultured Erythrobacter sp.]|uniref:serine hydrolase domain-containing protein n=1 Tax=uncultured Erythrobacter sp. TaxID=263913 RepID=UPI00261FEB57|nr:serine hydrolase domain-containing protein [uncultured Erythrobacter sp.]